MWFQIQLAKFAVFFSPQSIRRGKKCTSLTTLSARTQEENLRDCREISDTQYSLATKISKVFI